MKYLNFFENFSEDNKTGTIVEIDGETITWEDIKTKYRNNIINYYGNFDEAEKALSHLYDVKSYENAGGDIYRLIWLNDISEFNEEKPGHHWVSDPYDLEHISYMLSPHDKIIYKKDKNGKYLRNSMGIWVIDKVIENTKKPYIIHAHTPPNNVKIPFDYFNNLNEHEIFIKDQNKLKIISIERYKI